MRKQISVVLLFFLPMFLFAQETKKPVIYKINFMPVLSEHSNFETYLCYRTCFGISFEKQNKAKESYYYGISYNGPFSIVLGSRNTNFDDIRADHLIGGTVTAGKKYFIIEKKVMSGLYISPFADLSYYITSPWEDKSVKTNVIESHLSCVFGYQIVKESNFVIDVFSGIGLQIKNYCGDTKYTGFGIKPYLSLSLGNKF